MTKKAHFKTKTEIKTMAQGGKILARVKSALKKKIKAGVTAAEIEATATELILKAQAQPSFKMVPGYKWTTCVNINSGLVHGIPKKEIVFRAGDLVSVDLGVYFRGFHTDSAFTVLVGKASAKEKFLAAGEEALKAAIKASRPNQKIKHVSQAIETTLKKHNLVPIQALVGHGIGHELHEYPPVPCFVSGAKVEEFKLKKGLALAIEVMYTQENPEIMIDQDGWTIRMKDGKISALFEETVVIAEPGSVILTS